MACSKFTYINSMKQLHGFKSSPIKFLTSAFPDRL